MATNVFVFASWLAIASILCAFLGFSVAMATQTGSLSWVCIAVGTLVSTVAALSYLAHKGEVELGTPDIPGEISCMLFAFWFPLSLLMGGLNWMLMGSGTSMSNTTFVSVILAQGVVCFLVTIFLRSFGALFVACMWSRITVPQGLSIFVPDAPYPFILGTCAGNALVFILLCAASCTRYVRDQQLLLMIAQLPNQWSQIGASMYGGCDRDFIVSNLSLAPLNVVYLYLMMLFFRRLRVLPPALQGCKFVRMGYLRKMLAKGERICRCQDLPEEAFGDVRKCTTLLITSHRWLDRFKCDATTDEFPGGLRLTCMIRKLASVFPERLADTHGVFFARVAQVLNSFKNGGWDVLLFFDFMGIPQIGMDESGNQIPRTQAESESFFTILPAMGSLYTTFPVMILPEVKPGAHPYTASGWCASEFYSALLAKTLDEYSAEETPSIMTTIEHDVLGASGMRHRDSLLGGILHEAAVNEFDLLFCEDLGRKKFFNEDDREVVRGIVQGNLLARLLMDAVIAKDVANVRRHLDKLTDKGLISIVLLNPLNDLLDTVLHVAVRSSSAEIVRVLLEWGADPQALNLRGDTPAQCFMFPRFSQAAWLCRSYQASHSGPDNYAPMPH